MTRSLLQRNFAESDRRAQGINDSVAVPMTRKARRKIADISRATWIQTTAALIWIPQAALLAIGVGKIAAGGGTSEVLNEAAGVLCLGIVRGCLDAVGTRAAFLAARRELTLSRDAAVLVLARRSPVDAARTASGFAASAIGEQAEALVPYLSRFQPARMKATAVPIVILGCIAPISWVAALVLLLAAPLIPIFMALIGWRAKEASEQQLAETGGFNAFLLDRLRGLGTIRALDAVEITANRLRADAESLRRRTMAVLRIAFLSSAVVELFAALGVAMIAVYIGFSLLGSIDFGSWGTKLDLTHGLFVLLLSPAFFEPLRELSSVWHDRASGEAALDALDALAAPASSIIGQGDAASSDKNGPADVRIETVFFGYGAAGEPVLGDFSLRVAAGEHVALLGASGSGKSTILSLIAGLAPVAHGRILIDDTELTGETADGLRAVTAWIGQGPHLFAGTIAQNISLGNHTLTPADIASVLQRARLESVAEAYGKASIGEGGLGLSGGEALRLAIARAMANPHVRLILADEPTAHLDAATAADVTDGLLSLAAGKTLIIATHDPVLAARMDRVVQLDRALMEAAE